MPHRKSLSLVWRRYPQRYQLIGSKCLTCGTHFFPPRDFCPKCRRKGEIVEQKMKGTGKIHSFTVVRVPQEGFEMEVPYVLAVVELDEGPKLTAQIISVKPDEVSIGMPVKMVFRRISEDGDSGIINYGYKFEKA
ncbi:MAG: Zn-ribbon domain-containing OB-fold protein [Candidatus Diapherotrites archaeon]|nr:Zn-ribbon domain-containing OB-fold protein [Candidatus Diapherotrites archaeon]